MTSSFNWPTNRTVFFLTTIWVVLHKFVLVHNICSCNSQIRSKLIIKLFSGIYFQNKYVLNPLGTNSLKKYAQFLARKTFQYGNKKGQWFLIMHSRFLLLSVLLLHEKGSPHLDIQIYYKWKPFKKSI